MKILCLFSLVLFFSLAPKLAHAGSATWTLNPTSSDWNTAANWAPMTIPKDVASFSQSAITAISNSRDTDVASIVFEPGASAFTISPGYFTLTISGTGVVNNSEVEQNFFVASGPGAIYFTQDATAGDAIYTQAGGGGTFASTRFQDRATAGNSTFVNQGGTIGGAVIFSDSSTAANGTFYNQPGSENGGGTSFSGNSNAGNATFICDGGSPATPIQGFVQFYDNASAANGNIIANGASTGAFSVGVASFAGNSTAANATVTANGGTGSRAPGAFIYFSLGGGASEAANSTLIANGGSDGGYPGMIIFQGDSLGGEARVELFDGGTLDLTAHNAPGLSIGSIQGNGFALLGINNLTVGANDLSTIFAGRIEDGVDDSGGSLTKIGTSTLTLTGGSTYDGGTTVTAGTLVAANRSGSATGAGAVSVAAGTLSGGGTISGAVTMGTGSGTGAFLAPAYGTNKQPTLTILSELTFNSDATYTFTFKARSSTPKADKVVANGVTINSGATFNLSGTTQGTLAQGLVLTVILNTSATPITGTFSNLPDGGIVNVNGNNLQASYEGGDGNDLTLTVVP